MKRILIMVLCCLLFVGLCGCGISNATSGSETTTGTMSREQAESSAKNKIYSICANKVHYPNSAAYFDFGTFNVSRKDDHWYIDASGTFWSVDIYGDLEDKYTFSITLSVYDNGNIYEGYKDISKK